MDTKALYGTVQAESTPIKVTAGPVTALFTAGALRSIRHSGVEVMRGLHFLVRDRNWATLVPNLSDVEIDESGDRFRITYVAKGKTPSDGQEISWTGSIEADGKGLKFTVEALAEEDLLTCRAGFVVLHPLEKVAGCPVVIEHADDSIERSTFPERIDPVQCFFNVTGMTHEPIPGLKVVCRMEGGAWETEDHRNWMDASFKTYFRALAMPWPYTVEKGQPVRQIITLNFEGDAPAIAASAASTVVLGDRTGFEAPRIGVIADDLDAAAKVAGGLRGLGASYLVVRAATDGEDLPGRLARGRALAAAAGLKVALEIIVAERGLPAAQEIDLVAMAASTTELDPESVAVTSAADLKSYPPSIDRQPGHPLSELYVATHQAFPGVPIGGGSFAFFPELNRRRPPHDQIDFVQWGTASIIHAADDLSVMETLETPPYQMRSTRAILPGKPLRIGPVSIAMPLNPYGDGFVPNPGMKRQTTTQTDPRHAAQFGAAFACGYLARTTAGGAASVTFNAPAGDFGLFGPDGPVPAAAVVARFAACAGGAVLQAASSDPQRVLACAVEKEGRRTAMVANVTSETVTVSLIGWTVARASVLAAGSLEFEPVEFTGELVLPAYAVACLEG